MRKWKSLTFTENDETITFFPTTTQKEKISIFQSNRDASQARLHLKEHKISKCSPCEKSFANSHVLNEHLKIHHPQISAMFNCVFCSTILPLQNYDQIEEHLASHSRLGKQFN